MSSQSTQAGTMPTAPDSPSLSVSVSGNVQKFGVKKKKVLNAEEAELFELTQAAGISMDQDVFKVIVDLLKMNVAPLAVFQTLKAMCAGQKISDTIAPDTATVTEVRVRSKSSAGHAEKREQRVPRQASATRGQKSAKSSGSSSSSSQLTSN
ncbi:Mitotic-spindle organizing protein 2 [Bagarius yarrelli]|uniref:Mitotic-spindle organizing protein 2 n=1 Tax=Bagarius yarrelli TaxID=175774 RepID=A0A556TU85_BAGYA|nr:Mitotic-spindle organizing protein 2 [Bagarius yarrelli]